MVLEAPLANAGRFLVFDLGVALLKSILFLTFAAIGIRFASGVLRSIVSQKFSEKVVVDLITNTGRLFMWFGVILITLSILGFSGIAASMGTASGFVALGVAFALNSVIAETVAGAYLAHDPDFNSGDTVEVDGNKGVIEDVGLRKTRLRLENGDLRVINNADTEKKWTKINTPKDI